ncbi:MAG TPA: hypothetical protein VGN41_17505 [Streptosporangiaceae bacterium]
MRTTTSAARAEAIRRSAAARSSDMARKWMRLPGLCGRAWAG